MSNSSAVSCSSSAIFEPKMTVQSSALKSSEKKLRSVGSGGICMLTIGRAASSRSTFGYPATLPASKANPQVISGLMWEACWRGMSTALQVASPPLHTQTLTVKWWTSTPESLRFGPSEYLLRALSECARNLDRFWQSVVGRMKPYGSYFLDLRLVSIEFRAADKRVRRNLPTSDNFALRKHRQSITYAHGEPRPAIRSGESDRIASQK
jgi:hypothetical protein